MTANTSTMPTPKDSVCWMVRPPYSARRDGLCSSADITRYIITVPVQLSR